ncbi:unnamed protein product [Brachionus calyciflorus]|uniref:Uncharacterized protein n=1 Tax=Brachionus calyciflorus TaxID=104777 RepID=A0A814B4H0_9BILA|nr:unnamed protein product [Brachionus calyciflorus]
MKKINHICRNCSVSNINCKCKICKRSEELQVCIKCYFEFVEKRKTISEISKKTIKLVQLSDDFVADYHNFLAIGELMKEKKLSFLDLPKDIATKLSDLEDFYEVKIGVCIKNNTIYRTIQSALNDDGEDFYLFERHEEYEIFTLINFEDEYLMDTAHLI